VGAFLALVLLQTLQPYGAGIANGTAMAWAPDGRLFVCEQGGAVRVIKGGVLLDAPFHAVAVDSTGERGLIGIAFHPEFPANGFIYIHYTVASSPHNRISRLHAPAGADVSDGGETVIVELDPLSTATNHNGGAIHFGPDGKLYVGVGDNANGANAQSLSNRLGKILRYNPDGTVPDDNPFGAIWALGLRNPFTFAFQPGTRRMFVNDVGADGWEEVNEGIAGANYGWPAIEGDFDPAAFPGFTRPIHAYPHEGQARAISGGAFFMGKYFYAEFVGGWINSIDPDAPAAATRVVSDVPGPVDLQGGPDGALYVLVRSGTPGVLRVALTSPPAVPTDGDDDGGCGGTGMEALAAVGLLALWRRCRTPWLVRFACLAGRAVI
jgi:glucose/arabinose dehydrogenase